MKNFKFLLSTTLALMLANGCKKEEANNNNPSSNLPTLSTTTITAITNTTASSGGSVNTDGGSSIISRGVCWSINQNPIITDSKTTDGKGVGSFTSSITGLTENTIYYLRAYATNSSGTGYGNALMFTSGGTVTDIEGNVYSTVTIGTQVWMKENLKITKYRNGNTILTTSATNIPTDSTSKYQWANYNDSNVATYGRLYTWYTVTDSRNICPVGWHVPSDAEWTTLTDYLGSEEISGGKMKENGTSHWNYPNTGANNSSGFTALPGGYRIYDNGSFWQVGGVGDWWSASEKDATNAWGRGLSSKYSFATRDNYNKSYGFSVRCIKD